MCEHQPCDSFGPDGSRRPLWAPWRIEYIKEKDNGEGCFICDQLASADNGEENLVIARGETCFLLLNRYPYNSGHTMVSPYRHVGDISDLTDDELNETMALIVHMKAVLSDVMHPQGFNFGFNLGVGGGAGLLDHLHGHLVPRWVGDTNFMPVIADIRVVPEALNQTAAKLRQAWNARF